MNKSLQASRKPSFKCHSKDKHFISQLQLIKSYLRRKMASRFMISVDTDIPIQNVCRHIDALFKSNSVAIAKKDRCKVSGELVEYLTTDQNKFPKSNQLYLFQL